MVKPADQALQNFNTFITQLEGGALNEELTEGMRRCVAEIADACADRGGKHKATMTLTIAFEMDRKDRFVEITAGLAEKLPNAPRSRGGIFFCDESGNLLREDPRQMTLDDELDRQRRRRAGDDD